VADDKKKNVAKIMLDKKGKEEAALQKAGRYFFKYWNSKQVASFNKEGKGRFPNIKGPVVQIWREDWATNSQWVYRKDGEIVLQLK
jgi:hypothetical protein